MLETPKSHGAEVVRFLGCIVRRRWCGKYAFRKCVGQVLQTGIHVEDDGEDASITTVAKKLVKEGKVHRYDRNLLQTKISLAMSCQRHAQLL
jgi:hypothetical protein